MLFGYFWDGIYELRGRDIWVFCEAVASIDGAMAWLRHVCVMSTMQTSTSAGPGEANDRQMAIDPRYPPKLDDTIGSS